MNATAVIVAAGRGERFGDVAKILAPVNDEPMLLWSLRAANASRSVTSIIVVAGAHTEQAIAELVARHTWRVSVSIVTGGETRRESVASGVAAVPESTDVILVHDAARPLASPTLFDRCADEAMIHGAAIVAAPVTDTLKHVEGGMITRTIPRTDLWGAQTPQGFRRETLVSAIARTAHLTEAFTDEASMLEALGVPVAIVDGSPANLKVTHPEDLEMADCLLRRRCRHTEDS